VFESPSELLAYANEYMDSIERPPASPSEARERAELLAELIHHMRRFNFHAPKFGIRQLFSAFVLSEKEELLEALPQVERFSYSLNVRKWTYERAKIAYLAERLSYFLLKDNLMTDVVPHLPHGGSFLRFTERSGGAGFLVFRDLQRLLYGEDRTELLFEDEKLVSVERKRRKGLFPLSTAVLLASYSTIHATDAHWEEILREERGAIPHYEEVLEYESIVMRYDLSRIYDNPERLAKLFQELEEKGFLDEDGTVKPHILNAVRKKRFFRYNKLMGYASSYLSLFLVRYYLYYTPWSRRRKVPLRGVPQDVERLSPVLSSVELPDCKAEKEGLTETLRLARELKGVLPVGWKKVADTLVFKICPPLGRLHGDVATFLEGVTRPSGRARAFLDVLGEKDDKGKDAGRSGKAKKGRRS